MTTRVTVDFKDEPKVLASLRDRAKGNRRSLGAQLLFDLLPALTKPKRKPKAFTLVELLVTITLVGIIALVLMLTAHESASWRAGQSRALQFNAAKP